MSLIPCNAHASWGAFLADPWVMRFLEEADDKLEGAINPQKENILRFLTTDLSTRKVVLLGQDPYPQKGVATGRAFEVGGLTSWHQPFRQVSLKNLLRLIYISYHPVADYQSIRPYSGVLAEMEAGRFSILPPDRLFASWEEQGVLLLNTWLSVEVSRPGSHGGLWQPFSERLLTFISVQRPDLCWFLWGKNAQENKPFILNGRFYECRHPMMCSESYADDFLKSSCLKETMSLIDWKGK
jgi:uracil-DNA glycosylase